MVMKCAVCNSKLPAHYPAYQPDTIHFIVCKACFQVNLPIRIVSLQAACSSCKNTAFRYEDGVSPFIDCPCGALTDVLKCFTCQKQYSAPKDTSYKPVTCPNECGTTLTYASTVPAICIASSKQWSIYSDVNLPPEYQPTLRDRAAIQLVTQYYQDGSKKRQIELDMSLVNNLRNQHIETIHLLLEKKEDFNADKFNTAKIKCHVVGKRLSYKTAVEYANTKLAGNICILANCDVYFDHSLARINTHNMIGRVLALSRYDVQGCGLVLFNNFLAPVSQDAWVFLSPVMGEMDLDFNMGLPGCDNRISFEFAKAGYKVLNPCYASSGIIVRHLHQSEKRNYSETTTRVQGGYLPVPPVEDVNYDL